MVHISDHFLTLTPIGLPPNAPVAQKIADQNDVNKGWLVWINIVFFLFRLIRSNKL